MWDLQTIKSMNNPNECLFTMHYGTRSDCCDVPIYEVQKTGGKPNEFYCRGCGGSIEKLPLDEDAQNNL